MTAYSCKTVARYSYGRRAALVRVLAKKRPQLSYTCFASAGVQSVVTPGSGKPRIVVSEYSLAYLIKSSQVLVVIYLCGKSRASL